jgi:hypothetical protein
VLTLMVAMVFGVLLVGAAALTDQPALFLTAAGTAVAVVLFLTRANGLLARRARRH